MKSAAVIILSPSGRASNWTSASDVAPTSALVNAGQCCLTIGQQQRVTVAINDQWWRTTVDHHRTTVDHHRTTVDHRSTTGQRWLTDSQMAGHRPGLSSGPPERGSKDMFDTSILDDGEVVAEKEVSTANPVPTADYELAARLQEEERGELTIEEKSRLFVELMDKRKKYFTRLKAEKIRSKSPRKTQKRNQMCTYLKNMENYKHSQLKNKSFEEIQMLFNNTIKWIESFVPMDTELVKGSEKAAEGSSKRAGGKLEQEDAKRVYCVTTQNMVYYLLVEKMYLFTRNILHQMWNDVRLQVDYEVEMTYNLLRLTRRQISKGYVPK
nr:hypothetical protein [Tanacetum cinerariifolium]